MPPVSQMYGNAMPNAGASAGAMHMNSNAGGMGQVKS